MKKQRYIMVLIVLLACINFLSNYATERTNQDHMLTKEQIEAFCTAKTARIVVEQYYQYDENKAKKKANPILEALVREWLKFFGLKVLSTDAEKHDLEIKIRIRDIAYPKDEVYVTYPAVFEASISVEMIDVPIYTKGFKVRVGELDFATNLELIKEYRTIVAEDKMLYEFLTSFENDIINRLVEIFGISRVITRLKDENETIRKCSALSLRDLHDPRAIEPLIKALKDNDEDFRMHIDDALFNLTGESFGGNQKKWLDWWNKNKEKFIKKK